MDEYIYFGLYQLKSQPLSCINGLLLIISKLTYCLTQRHLLLRPSVILVCCEKEISA